MLIFKEKEDASYGDILFLKVINENFQARVFTFRVSLDFRLAALFL